MPERSSGPHRRLLGWREARRPAGRVPAGERALTRRLQTLPAGPAPDPAFRAELRAQLVAVASRLVEEGPLDAGALATPTEGGARETDRVRRRVRLPRPALVLASAAAVLIVLLGTAVFLSRGSLPGDTLYSLKRANEDVRLSVTRGEESRGKTYLAYSTRRVHEVEALTQRVSSAPVGPRATAAGGISEATSDLIVSTLRAGDADARRGAKLVAQHAVGDVSAEPLTFVLSWSRTQRADLARSMARLPAGDARTAAAHSIGLVTTIAGRVSALRSQIGCSCLTTVTGDDLGPLPCTQCPTTTSPQTTAPTTAVPGTTPSRSSAPRATTSRPGGRSATTAQPRSTPSSAGNGGGGGGGTSTGTPPRTGGNGNTTKPTSPCVLVVCLPSTPTLPTLPIPTLPTINLPTLQLPTGGAADPTGNAPYPPGGRGGNGAVDPAKR